MNTTTQIIHDEYGLSKAHRWLACPGSVNRSRGIPDESGEAAERGNRIHAACQAIADKMLDAVPAEASDEEYALAIAMVRHGEALAEHFGVTPETPFATEIPQDVSTLGIARDGHIDRLWILPDCVIVLDYKSGKIMVEAEDNPQLAGYAIAAAEEYGVSRAVCIIVQPDMDDNQIHGSAWELVGGDLDEWKTRIKVGKRIAEKSTALVPGDHCRYCPASLVCEARSSIIHLMQPATPQEMWTMVESMDALQRGDLVSRLTEASKWCEEIVDAVKRHLQVTGLTVSGWKFKNGASIRIWSDPAQAERTLLAYAATVGIPDESIREVKLKSPAAIDKEGQVPAEIWNTLVGTRENKPSLVADKSKKKEAA